jgi:hypothetical protein
MPHIVLGTDGFGMIHHFDAAEEEVHVIDPAEGRMHIESVDGRPVEDWMAFISDKRGWSTKQYGVGLDQLLARSLEGSAPR